MTTRVLDLRRTARRATIPRLDVGEVTAADLEAARTNWRERMASEHASARVFGALVGGMMNAGLPAAETSRVANMVRQELEHAELCATVLTALGSEPVAQVAELAPVPEHADASPLEAILRNVISVGCCSETVAVALVATEREQAGPRPLRRVLDQILRDEIKHSRFGWRLVDRYAPALTAKERASLGDYLVDAFAHQIRFHASFLAMPCASEAGVAIGRRTGAPTGSCSSRRWRRSSRQRCSAADCPRRRPGWPCAPRSGGCGGERASYSRGPLSRCARALIRAPPPRSSRGD